MTTNNLIETFVAKTLVDENPHRKCFTMCYILSIYMDVYNIEHTIKSGIVENFGGHYIITLEKNEYKIVDPTAKQINEKNPLVLIQKKEEPYLNFNEIEFVEFKGVYENWEHRLLNDGDEIPSKNSTPCKIDIIPYIRILLRAYLIFKQETFELKSKEIPFPSETVNQYFDWFHKIANKNKDKKGKLDNTLLNEKFDKLLTSLEI